MYWNIWPILLDWKELEKIYTGTRPNNLSKGQNEPLKGICMYSIDSLIQSTLDYELYRPINFGSRDTHPYPNCALDDGGVGEGGFSYVTTVTFC